MNNQIFVNLPVKDLEKSKAFFAQMGYTYNNDFTDEKAACMIIGPNIYAMLLSEPFFKSFIPTKNIADASNSTEVLIALSAETKEEVNELVDKAIAAGATIPRPPDDHGFMFARSFEDPDGHIWEVVWMNPEAMPPASN